MSNSPDLSEPISTGKPNHKEAYNKYMDGFRINKHIIIYVLLTTIIWFMAWHFSLAAFEYYNVSSQLIRGFMFAILAVIVIIIAWRLK